MTDSHQSAAPHPQPTPELELEPGDLPSGWVETTLGEATGYGSTNKAEPHEIPADAWVLELEDIEKDTSKVLTRATFAQRESKSTKNRFSAGDILYGKLRPYLNKVVLAHDDGFCTTEIVPIRQQEYTDSRYVFYWLKHPTFLKYVSTVSHGMNMPRLGTDAGQQAPFILAPLPEQIRIADKLDTLLARVEAGRERLARVPKLLARLRQSILSAAVSGELTREWRGGGDAEWETKTLGEIAPDITYGYTASSTTQPIGPKMLRITDIQNDAVNWDTVPFCEIGTLEHQKYLIKTGDLVFARTGATVGKSYLIQGEIPESVYASYLIRVRPKNSTDSLYLKYFFQSPNYWEQVLDMSAGIGQPNVNGSKLKSLLVPLPPLPKQAEIVRRVELLFAHVDALERQYSAAAKSFDRLTPALLQKAFRGELVPQDPNDEPAAALLERIRAARGAAGEKPRRGRGGSQPKRAAATPEPDEARRRGRPRGTGTAGSEAEARAMLQARKAAREVAFQDAPQGDRMPELFSE